MHDVWWSFSLNAEDACKNFIIFLWHIVILIVGKVFAIIVKKYLDKQQKRKAIIMN